MGGSGNYIWSSSNSSFASVNKKGVVIAGYAIGVTKVRAADVKNPSVFAESMVKVIPPDDMVFTASVVEVEIGSQLVLPITVSAFLDSGKRLQ